MKFAIGDKVRYIGGAHGYAGRSDEWPQVADVGVVTGRWTSNNPRRDYTIVKLDNALRPRNNLMGDDLVWRFLDEWLERVEV